MNNKPKRIYEFGPFRLDAGEHLLLRDGAAVPLTPKALDLLLVLVERHGHLQEKEVLFKAVWPDTIVEESNLSSHIAAIRKALGEGGNGVRYIETVPKRGYRFVAEVRDVAPAIHQTLSAKQVEKNVEAALPAPLLAPLLAEDARRVSRASRWMLPVTLLAFGLVVVATSWWVASRRSPPSPEMRVTPFTTLPGKEIQPCFSPDGNQIAFVWDGEQENNQDIYVKQIGGETLLRLTTDPAADTDPAWSPDGRFIAFLRRTPGRGGFYVVPVIGGPERKLADAFQKGLQVYGRRLNYGPDGRFLAVADKSSAEEPFSLFLLSTETGERRKLTSPPTSDPDIGDRSPAFSPDGKWIAFSRSVSSFAFDIYVAPVAGGEPVRLTFDNIRAEDPAWTPDGREIIFKSNRGGGPGLWRISAMGGAPERFVGTGRIAMGAGEIADSIAISRQGDRLAYPQAFSDYNIWRLELSTPAAQSRRPTKLISATLEDHSPQYSPDGERIVFVSARSGNRELWLCDSEGKRPVQLTDFRGPVTGTPRWSPDGRSIVFDSRPEGNADIFVIDPETRQPRRLTSEPSLDAVPSWSRDGLWIYFNSDRSGSLQIWKMRSAGGPAVQVTRKGGFEGFESSDGKFLYYTKGRNIPGLWRVPTAGGEETLVLDHHRVGYWRYWAVSEQGIYFATAEKPEQPLIEFFSFRTGQISPIATLEKPISNNVPGLAVSPDGRWLIWTQLDQEGSDIMLMESFR